MMTFPSFGWVLAFAFISTLTFMEGSRAFVAPERSLFRPVRNSSLEKFPVVVRRAESNDGEEASPQLKTPQETKVYQLLKELSDSNLSFRIVVVGNGAILESTNPLGPKFKLGESPKTGASIVTFASEDQSFEFHLMPAQIASAALVEKSSPAKEGRTLRLLRFLNGEGGSICSLILADDSSSAKTWYESMAAKYGSSVDFS